MAKRHSNRPDRRVAPERAIMPSELARLLSEIRYEGSALHKLRPGDYGFLPPTNPRPSKSVCDDLGPLPHARAVRLLHDGLKLGMVSAFDPGSAPKYVWAVDEVGEVYEAKTKPPDSLYHGYRLGDDDQDMRRYIRSEWRNRCGRQ